MDVLPGEVRTQTSDHFPEHISPFPSSFDSLFPGPEARVSVPDITPPFPAQKLRPIRCSGKRVAGVTDAEASSCPASGEFRVVSGQGSLGLGLGEVVGFVNNLRDEHVEVCGGGESEVRMLVDAAEARIGKVDTEEQNLGSGSSSESEVSGEPLENVRCSENRQRRRTIEQLEGFMLKLVSKLLMKQEAMHNQLMEMLERMERERVMKEETWKQQEIERLRREEHVRAQETARNIALISFIQNMMGKDFQMEKPSTNNSSKDEGEVYHQLDTVCGRNGDKCPTSEKDHSPDSNCLPSQASPVSLDNERWLKSEVHALIQLRGNLEGSFYTLGSKCSIWDEVSARLLGMGYRRPATKCKEKWEHINICFKRAKISGISEHLNSFTSTNNMYKQGVMSPLCDPNTNSTE